jgi:hypothetical protein
MELHPPSLLYKNLAYEFVAQTLVPGNEGIEFYLDKPLPTGLYLETGEVVDKTNYPVYPHTPSGQLAGTIYGSPLSYTEIDPNTKYTLTATVKGLDPNLFTAKLTFPLTLANTPNNSFLDTYINGYPITVDPKGDLGNDGRIGTKDSDGTYKIKGNYDEVGDQILHIGDKGGVNSYDRFHSVWLDGKKLDNSKYTHERGSTRVTVLSQTVKELGNGDHTIAVAFTKDKATSGSDDYEKWNNSDISSNNLDVVAQNFTVDLDDNPNPDVVPEKARETADSDVKDKETWKQDSKKSENETNSQGIDFKKGKKAFDDGNTPLTDRSGSNATGSNPDGQTLEAPDTEGTGAVTGFTTDANGNSYFDWDGKSPLEIRIDIPLEEFNGLDFDGENWVEGEDFTSRSGSTIITVPPQRLEQIPAGTHTILSHFDSQDIEIAFELIKPQELAVNEKERTPEMEATKAELEEEESGKSPVNPIVILVVALVAAFAGGFALSLKKRNKKSGGK